MLEGQRMMVVLELHRKFFLHIVVGMRMQCKDRTGNYNNLHIHFHQYLCNIHRRQVGNMGLQVSELV
jgi:hypothetical protein